MESPTKKRYNDQELEEFKALILEKIEEAQSTMGDLKNSLESSYENSGSFTVRDIEDASDSMEREYLILMIERQRKYIINLNSALTRIANKTYGICRSTGKINEKNRLKIVPHATMSVEAKNGRG